MDSTYERYLLSKSRQMKIPLKASLELTPLCNMDCKMCYVHELKNNLKNPIQPVAYWMSLMPVLKDLGTLFVTLIGGEPFLYPGIDKLYQLLSDNGFFVSITTNGTLLANGLPEWMVKSKPKYVTVSLYGASDETYLKVTGNPHGFSQVMKAVQYLEEADIPLQFNYTVIPENVDDLETIMSYAKNRNHPINASHYCYPSCARRESNQNERLSPEKSAEAFWKIIKFKNKSRYVDQLKYYAGGNYQQWNPTYAIKTNCNAGKSQMWISWKGQMSGCGILPGEEPFVSPDNLGDLWNEIVDATDNIRTSEQCALCPLRDICGVCPAMMYSETGSFDGTPNYICEITKAKIALAKILFDEEI